MFAPGNPLIASVNRCFCEGGTRRLTSSPTMCIAAHFFLPPEAAAFALVWLSSRRYTNFTTVVLDLLRLLLYGFGYLTIADVTTMCSVHLCSCIGSSIVCETCLIRDDFAGGEMIRAPRKSFICVGSHHRLN